MAVLVGAVPGALDDVPAGSVHAQMLIPHRVAMALQADGWWLRSTVIGAKRAPMPESIGAVRWEPCKVKVSNGQRGREERAACDDRPQQDHGRDFAPSATWSRCPGCDRCRDNDGLVLRRSGWRPTTAHEYLFILAPGAEYYADGHAVMEVAVSDLRNCRSVIDWPPEPASFDFCAGCGAFYEGEHRRPKDSDGKRTCRCGRTDVWLAHYALMPLSIAEWCVRLSPEKVCAACGAPWARVVDSARTLDGEAAFLPAMRTTDKAAPMSAQGGHGRTGTRRVYRGHRPTCGCGAASAPAIVLDPFSGAGTTGVECVRLGRRYLGCELRLEYAAMSVERMRREAGEQVGFGFDAMGTSSSFLGERDMDGDLLSAAVLGLGSAARCDGKGDIVAATSEKRGRSSQRRPTRAQRRETSSSVGGGSGARVSQGVLFDLDYRGSEPALCPPLIKYAGAKRWLVPLLVRRLHLHLANVGGVYVEPFCGGMAMGLGVGWQRSVYCDASADLANLYRTVRDDPGAVADALEALKARRDRAIEDVSDEDFYYSVREESRAGRRSLEGAAEGAARVVYLNRTGFNGLMRTNRRGEFNVPWGDREFVPPPRAHVLRVGEVLRSSEVIHGDFAQAVARAREVSPTDRLAVYLDPPYGAKLKDSTTRGARDRGGKSGDGVFTGYAGAFTWADQVRLADLARGLAREGALVIASNTWDDAVCDLYRDGFSLFQVAVRHAVGAKGERRGRRAEMVAIDEAHAGVLDMEATGVKVRAR